MKVKVLMYKQMGMKKKPIIFEENYSDEQMIEYLKKYKNDCYDIEIETQKIVESVSLYNY